MAEHIWSVVSQKAIIDRDSNNISLFDVVERVSFHGPKEPGKDDKVFVPFNHVLTSYWMRSNGEKPEKINCKVTWGKVEELFSQILEVDLTKFKKTRIKFEPGGFRFAGSGLYFYRVFVQEKKGGKESWKRVASIPIEISFSASPKENTN